MNSASSLFRQSLAFSALFLALSSTAIAESSRWLVRGASPAEAAAAVAERDGVVLETFAWIDTVVAELSRQAAEDLRANADFLLFHDGSVALANAKGKGG